MFLLRQCNTRLRLLNMLNIYMSGLMKTISKVDDIKIKSKVSAFCLPLPLYLPFITLLSLLFVRLQGLKKA